MNKKKPEKENIVERQDRILRLEREKNRINSMKQNFENYYLSEIMPRYYKIKKGKCKKWRKDDYSKRLADPYGLRVLQFSFVVFFLRKSPQQQYQSRVVGVFSEAFFSPILY